MPGPERESLIESLMDTELYSIGATLLDTHPEMVDEVVSRAEQIERSGLEAWATENDVTLESAVQTLLAGLAVRYFRALAG